MCLFTGAFLSGTIQEETDAEMNNQSRANSRGSMLPAPRLNQKLHFHQVLLIRGN